jgi:AcrR family transcriptional regulator
MGTKERRERQKESLRQEILDAAREMFASEGFENVSMRKIAEKIEYSPTTIYLYFKDKSDLIYQLCEESFAKLGQILERIRRKHDDPLEALREAAQAYVKFGLQHPNHYKVIFIIPLQETLDHDDYAFEGSMGERAFNYLRNCVAECIRQGKFRQVDPELTSQALWAGMHGVTSLLIAHKDFPWVSQKKLIEQVIEMMIRGLRP